MKPKGHVHKAYAKARLTTYAKTERSRRRVPLRAKVLAALNRLSESDGIVFPIRPRQAARATFLV